MLNNLDVVISFATIMLGVSMIVMVLTQTISALFNLRGARLKDGLEELFRQSGLDAENAKIVDWILMHPLVSDGVLWRRLAPAIHKQELLVLMEMVKDNPEFKEVEAKLQTARGIVEQWFDSSMNRVSHKFAGWMRGITIVFSFLVAIPLHLDSMDLLSRLSSNAELRQSLLGSSQALQRRAEAYLQAPPTEAGSAHSGAGTADIKLLADQANAIRGDLENSRFQLFPTPDPAFSFGDHAWGILASGILLSLGAPFWFNVLRTASTLRPVLATKVENAEAQEGKKS